MALHRPWVGWAFHSTHAPHARSLNCNSQISSTLRPTLDKLQTAHSTVASTEETNFSKLISTFDRAATELASTEQEFATNPTPATAAQLKMQSRVVIQLQYTKARQKLFEYGEKAGKLLAYLVHSEDRPPVVITLHGPGNQQITDPQSVTSIV